jgi:hypothetical protein
MWFFLCTEGFVKQKNQVQIMVSSILKTANNIKKSAINTVILLIIGTGIGGGSVIWMLQANANGICSLLSAKNQFINIVQKDSK